MTNKLTQFEEEKLIRETPISEYASIHYWLRKNYGKAKTCESEQCNKKSKNFNWALLVGFRYERKRENFTQRCRSCHAKMDTTMDTIEKMKKIGRERGTPFTPEQYRKFAKKLTGRNLSAKTKKKIAERMKAQSPKYAHKGETLSIRDWCKRIGISDTTFQRRVLLGWAPARIIETPLYTRIKITK